MELEWKWVGMQLQRSFGRPHAEARLPHAAKNIILAGVRAVTIHDQKTVEVRDLSAQFYLTEDSVGQNRAEACKEQLQELNTSVDVSASAEELTPEFIGQFQVRPQQLLPPCNHNHHLVLA